MKRPLSAILALLLASCAAPPHAPPPPPGPVAAIISPLEGVWREVTNEGAPVAGIRIWTFRDGAITITDDDETFAGAFTADTAGEPNALDMRFEGYPVNRAIFSVEGDMLTVKVLDTSEERATSFGIEPGYISIVCTRIGEAGAP
ncbi:MAG: hypothetical protein PHN82_02925 [bacterium]|nr:hypothetical protein [bacterium]